jgi:GNAT superfamily N-acetyltransferase
MTASLSRATLLAVNVKPGIDLDIAELDRKDESALRAFWSVSAAAHRVDAPLIPMTPLSELLAEHSDERSMRRQRWMARHGDQPVGIALLVLPDLDNTDAAHLTLEVHPEARRSGIGRALLAVACARMREQRRTHVVGMTAEPLDGITAEPLDGMTAEPLDGIVAPGAAFAAAVGAERALDEICRALELHDISDDRLTALEDEATTYAAGYELVQWVGRCSDDIVDDLAVLTGRMTTDAPMGELDWEPEAWDRERYREAEERTVRLGRRWVTTAARHLASGRVVAYTDIGWSEQVESGAFQWMTIVAPEHRGKRLGMLIKAANLRALRREMPRIERVITWNADSNTQMISINEALGFRPMLRFGQWQLQVAP